MEVYLFFKFVFIIANFIWFFSLNNRFIYFHPNYQGKLWGLLFFPTYLILFSIFSVGTWSVLSFSGFINFKTGIIFIITGIILTVILFQYFNKLKDCLFNWNNTSQENGLHAFTILSLIGLIFDITNTIFFYQMFKYVWNTVIGQLLELFWFLAWFIDGLENKVSFPSDKLLPQLIQYQVVTIVVYLVFYIAGKNKLKDLSTFFTSSYSNSFVPPVYQPIGTKVALSESSVYKSNIFPNSDKTPQLDHATKLKELKQLLEDGILTEEEFSSMKKDILKDWK